MTRIQDLLEESHPDLKNKRVLIVDDEADMASIRFTKKKGEETYDQGTIANQMDTLRGIIKNVSFLQVTATPYALYLQPENYESASEAKEIFYPKRPSFTELLPIHDAYIGGDAYFGGHGPDDPRHYLYVEVDAKEHDALRSNDGRTIREDRLWTSENIITLRRSLITFLLSVAVRRHQQRIQDKPLLKYAMIMHNDTQREAHNWQWETVEKLRKLFENAVEKRDPRLEALFDHAYDDIRKSVEAGREHVPSREEAFKDVCQLIDDGELNVQRVNSDAQLDALLDQETAELKLRTKANLFIGGSILDRGITIPNLVAFYYGRNPKQMQADTVLQHSRMYGARPHADLAVTRFYTSPGVYSRLVKIHSLETALREAFESGSHDKGVVFIQNDKRNGIIPCAPAKISLSNVIAVKPNEILTPTRFNTVASTHLKKLVRDAEKLIPSSCLNTRTFAEIKIEDAVSLIETISQSLEDDSDPGFDWSAMIGLLKYYADKASGKILILAESDRKLGKSASGDRSGISILGTSELRQLIKEPSRNSPALIILKQEGGPELGWKAGPFLWPMLASPPQAKSCVFSTKTAA